jgi:anthranilate phosphoribosyltransferase
MSIASYIKEIGRGKDGSRSLGRADAATLMGTVLDGEPSDLEVGAFCLAMRMKGETSDELLGFVDAAQARMPAFEGIDTAAPWVVLPSYNGARKLPVLTALLGALLERRGLNVLIHGMPQDPLRVTTAQVLGASDAINMRAWNVQGTPTTPLKGLKFMPTAHLNARLAWLLGVRRVVGVRNSGHSIVKLMNPLAQSPLPSDRVLVVSSYTHPEFFESMGCALPQLSHRSILMRGTEGEPVADPRRMPRLEGFKAGQRIELEAQQDGPITTLPNLPTDISAASTAAFVDAVLRGALPCPKPIELQVERILHLLRLE